ncbi:MAG: serine/threonine protein kinase, partial [Nitrospirae bacterium]|nr:serine/threonine protein kinase [Nitrospirota bacterium]
MEVGQYRVIDKIGEGGAGIVYKAEHTLTKQTVAIKELSREFSISEDMKERFIREARIQAKLNHKNIVRLYNFIEQDGLFYLIMEYMEGKRLDHIIKEQTPMEYGKCLQYFKQILDGVGFAHSQGIIHRDIKPANVIVDNDGTIKIMDFGIAKGQDDAHLTKTGTSMGTLRYMAPEQVRGEKVGVHSDVYSLGMTLYEMVTGSTPFKSDSAYHLMKEIVDEAISSPAKFRNDIPETIENAIMKACAKNPSDRFVSTSGFSKALDDWNRPISGEK